MTDAAVERINRALELVDREIWIVTSQDGDRRGGLVATWVSLASIDPQRPIMAIALGESHFTADLVAASSTFACHLLAEEHIELAWRFGLTSGRDSDKLAGLSTTTAASGAPVLEQCLAWFDCRAFAEHRLGDRRYFWAEILAGDSIGQGPPLRQSQLFAAANAEQLETLRKNLWADVELERRASPLAK